MRDRSVELPGRPTCPTLDVPLWWWTAADLGERIALGHVSDMDVDADVWDVALSVQGALHRYREAERKAQDRREEIKRAFRARQPGET